jgi:hypothetical protein
MKEAYCLKMEGSQKRLTTLGRKIYNIMIA